MYKSILFICSLFVIFSFKANDGIYNYSVQTIRGESKSLSEFRGRKLLVITLPIERSSNSDSFLISLDSLANLNSVNLKVIAVPSIEDGFTFQNRDSLLAWYESRLSGNIIISDGLRTHRQSGSDQSPLFRWLSSIGENQIFDTNPDSPCYKFFVNSTGDLYGVLNPTTNISSLLFQRAMALNQ